ncbi:MarR family transcriptional regulator [Nocardia cyriacigeorgica]|uniref:MarR family transcriptional regulator n=1 Tax=Nocardia cyriacigeorgica TaxID=135487 RepID=A0A6P1D7Y5_9NOCA|nr:MarR family transcriptional regulator [Nocardia cyriacigeorgica]NEW37446.1 MarR family transcriptional regulator [Nocardia cyriacigeorgica]NEW44923.1 MarR family transcriptional regulator [Nocardia cyriacigeorgica]NEW49166.1 MarR family transcriptional regulator [Nocardia cyriacigeorgica]NEW59318.1 MarR family transcriptional regulator [Nocardia cyriacigeorgica]
MTVDPRPEDEPNIGLLLFLPYRAMENRVLAALATAGYADVTLAQARIVQRIGPAGTRLTDLAEQAQVTKQTAGFLVDQLERAGYVERVPDPTDGRARLVRLSDRGRRATALANSVATDVEAEWSDHLGPRATAQLRRALLRLREFTDPYR